MTGHFTTIRSYDSHRTSALEPIKDLGHCELSCPPHKLAVTWWHLGRSALQLVIMVFCGHRTALCNVVFWFPSKKCPFKWMGSLYNHDIHLMTTVKKARKLLLASELWLQWLVTIILDSITVVSQGLPLKYSGQQFFLSSL